VAGLDHDRAFGVALTDDLSDRLGGVHDQMQEDLVDLAGKAGHGGQVRVGPEGDLGHVFPFVSRHGDGTLDGLVQVDLLHRTLERVQRVPDDSRVQVGERESGRGSLRTGELRSQ
jgi:hypothetical protein